MVRFLVRFLYLYLIRFRILLFLLLIKIQTSDDLVQIKLQQFQVVCLLFRILFHFFLFLFFFVLFFLRSRLDLLLAQFLRFCLRKRQILRFFLILLFFQDASGGFGQISGLLRYFFLGGFFWDAFRCHFDGHFRSFSSSLDRFVLLTA